MLIDSMRATSPSFTTIDTPVDYAPAGRQRRCDLDVVAAADRYCFLISCSALSSVVRSKNATFREPGIPQRLLQRILVEFLCARDVNRGDGRSLDDRDDNDIVLNLDAHVAKETGRKQALIAADGAASSKRSPTLMPR